MELPDEMVRDVVSHPGSHGAALKALVMEQLLARLDTIERRAQQIRGGLKPYASPVEIVDFLLAEVD